MTWLRWRRRTPELRRTVAAGQIMADAFRDGLAAGARDLAAGFRGDDPGPVSAEARAWAALIVQRNFPDDDGGDRGAS